MARQPGQGLWLLGRARAPCAADARRARARLDPAFQVLPKAIRDIEAALSKAFAYDKINYLMLMMVDPEVHYHVIPRYAEPRDFGGKTFADTGWPKTPNLGDATALDAAGIQALAAHLKSLWPE